MLAPHTLEVQDAETKQAPRELEMRSPSTDRFDSQKSTDPVLNIPSNPYL